MTLLHSGATPAAARLGRRWAYVIWIVAVALDPFHALADWPASQFRPIGPLLVFLPATVKAAFVTVAGLWALKLALLAALTASLLRPGRWTRSVPAALLLTAYQGVVFGFGPINHSEMAFLMAVWIFAAADVADALHSGDRRVPVQDAFPLVCVAGFLLLSYAFVGIYRLANMGGALLTSDSIVYWIAEHSHRWYYDHRFPLGLWLVDLPGARGVIRAGFVLSTIVEILAPACLVSSRVRRLFVPYMVLFHVFVAFFMNIVFLPHLLMFVYLLDLNRVAAAAGRLASTARAALRRPAVC